MLLKKYLLVIFILVQTSFLFSHENETDKIIENKIGVYENLGSIIPLNLEFINEYNQNKTIKDIINNKPTIITLNYFDCPTLCSPLLNEVANTLNKVDLKPYIDYNVITISFEKNDKPKHALAKKKSLLPTITKSFPPQTWSFLTSSQKNIDEITNALGFKYEKRVKDGVTDYLHPGVIIIVSPSGKITRYLNGIEYLPFDVKLALLEASDEQTRPTITKTLLYCFAYDAKSKTYLFQAEKVVGSFMFAIVLIFFLYLVKTGRQKDKGDE